MLIKRVPWRLQPQGGVALSELARKSDLFFEQGGLLSTVGPGALTVTSTPEYLAAPYGRGRYFTAAAQYLVSSGWPVLADGTEYTYLVVFHRVSASGGFEFLINGDNGNRAFQFRLESSGAVGFIAFNTAVSTFSATGTVVPVGFAHCAVVVVSASGVRLYQNGIRTATSSAITGTIKGQAAGDIQVGNRLGSYLRGTIGQIARWPYALSDDVAKQISANPWQLFAPRSIWVPVSVSSGGGTDLTIQEATHAHTADGVTVTLDTTLATADATHAHTADGLALTLDTTLAIAKALHAHTADNLTITADGSTDLAIADALHGHAADSLTIATTGEDVSLGAAGKRARRRRFQDYDVPIPPELVKSTIPSDKVAEPVAPVAPVDARASKLAKKSALQGPAPKAARGKKVEALQPIEQPAQAAQPQPAAPAQIASQPDQPQAAAPAAQPRPMMLSDILSAETMTPEEMTAAIKLLARIQLGPQLMRTVPRARLIREPG